jgi:hypothetical protein
MSLRLSNIPGADPQSWKLPYDRSGGWANYRNMLSLQNAHDRMTYNGEVNTVAGMRNMNAFYPIIKKPQSENVSGYPMSKSRVRKQNFKVKVPPESETTKKLHNKGINLAYLSGVY